MEASKICEMLNGELGQRPAFMQTMLSTLWTVAGVPEHIDVTPLGDDYCTNVLGVINGCLKASGSIYSIGTVTVKDNILFIPVKSGETNEEVSLTQEAE